MNLKRCTAGKNKDGKWHIACDQPAASGHFILMDMKYTQTMSPQAICYYKAARWIMQHGGRTWTTNALQVPTTAVAMPKNPQDDPC
ncbi:MAG: hypothetical protein PHO65_01620 [Sulfurovum sp.]|nr:hypothetical protein [Sulfurovum sp.]